MHISSRDNSLLRKARSVRDGKDDDLIFVEGLRLAEEVFKSGLLIEAVIYSDEIVKKERASTLIAALSKVSTKNASVSEKLLESVSYTKTPQGIVVLAHRPDSGIERLTSAMNKNSLLVILHQVNNPVNVGAILRTAEAAGVSGVITTKKTSDPFSPKSLRGAMGSAFRLPVWADANYPELINWCSSNHIHSVSTAVSALKSYTDFDWTQPVALILGTESSGLTEDEISATRSSVRIPMLGEVESLNVSVAAGIVLFEAARQRGFKV